MSEVFKELSPAEFLRRNSQLAGLENPQKAAFTTIREIVENSLDSCEMRGYSPSVEIELLTQSETETLVSIVDNGSGVPENEIPNAFGRVLYGSKYVLRQQRGELGLGGKIVLILSSIETNKPYRIMSAHEKEHYICLYDLSVDLQKNEPIIHSHKRQKNTNKQHGLLVKFHSKANFTGTMSRIIEYLQMTSTICPYASLVLKKDGETLFKFDAVTKEMPPRPKIVKYHPRGIDTSILKTFLSQNTALNTVLSQFLTKNFQRVTEARSKRFIAYNRLEDKDVKSLSDDDIVNLVEKLKSYPDFIAPDTSCLSPITEPVMKTGVKSTLSPDFSVYSRRKTVHRGHGMIIEVMIAIGGSIPAPAKPFDFLSYRFANKIPLLYDKGACAMTKALEGINFKSYGLEENTPACVVMHTCSTHVPYKTVGKEYISPDFPEINQALTNALQDAFRSVRLYMSKRHREASKRKRESIFNQYLPVVAEAVSGMTQSKKEVVLKDLLGVLKKE